MNRLTIHVPSLLIIAAGIFLLAYGPIPQLPHYHEFADQGFIFGIPHGADVLSNVGFAVVGIWGLLSLWPAREHPGIVQGWPGYRLFLLALVLTAIGSGYYHLHPDNSRLFWDRLPIALASAGLIAAVRSETNPNVDGSRFTILLGLAAVLSLAWWVITDQVDTGDLGPYLLLQASLIVLIPLWQTIYGAPRADRLIFAGAIAFYVLAKIAEYYDHEVLHILGWISGHTIKHVLAVAGAALITARLVYRVRRVSAATDDKLAVTHMSRAAPRCEEAEVWKPAQPVIE